MITLLRDHEVVIVPWLHTKRLILNDSAVRLSPDGQAMLRGWSHYKFRERLRSAAARYSGRHVLVSEEPGTSKTCTHCGAWKADLTLGHKAYACAHCGVCVDRQLAGARNNFLAAYGCALGVHWDGLRG